MSEQPARSRNPTWSRDELILALDVYFQGIPFSKLSPSHPLIIELSETLNMLAAEDKTDPGRYRNPNGVSMKMGNFARIDPQYIRDGRRGLSHGGDGERPVWDEFAGDRERLHQVATAIRANVVAQPKVARTNAIDPDTEAFAPEGAVLYRIHATRERDGKLIKQRKALALKQHGELRCEVCDLVFAEMYGTVGNGYIEAHHTTPVSQMAPGAVTRVKDLALVCPNCHRMLHAGGELLTPVGLRATVHARRKIERKMRSEPLSDTIG